MVANWFCNELSLFCSFSCIHLFVDCSGNGFNTAYWYIGILLLLQLSLSISSIQCWLRSFVDMPHVPVYELSHPNCNEFSIYLTKISWIQWNLFIHFRQSCEQKKIDGSSTHKIKIKSTTPYSFHLLWSILSVLKNRINKMIALAWNAQYLIFKLFMQQFFNNSCICQQINEFYQNNVSIFEKYGFNTINFNFCINFCSATKAERSNIKLFCNGKTQSIKDAR